MWHFAASHAAWTGAEGRDGSLCAESNAHNEPNTSFFFRFVFFLFLECFHRLFSFFHCRLCGRLGIYVCVRFYVYCGAAICCGDTSSIILHAIKQCDLHMQSVAVFQLLYVYTVCIYIYTYSNHWFACLFNPFFTDAVATKGKEGTLLLKSVHIIWLGSTLNTYLN